MRRHLIISMKSSSPLRSNLGRITFHFLSESQIVYRFYSFTPFVLKQSMSRLPESESWISIM